MSVPSPRRCSSTAVTSTYRGTQHTLGVLALVESLYDAYVQERVEVNRRTATRRDEAWAASGSVTRPRTSGPGSCAWPAPRSAASPGRPASPAAPSCGTTDKPASRSRQRIRGGTPAPGPDDSVEAGSRKRQPARHRLVGRDAPKRPISERSLRSPVNTCGDLYLCSIWADGRGDRFRSFVAVLCP